MLARVAKRLPAVVENIVFDFVNGLIEYHRIRYQLVLEQLRESLYIKRMFESPLIELTSCLEHLYHIGIIKSFQLAIRNGLVSHIIDNRTIHHAIPIRRYRLIYTIDWTNPKNKPITIVMRRFDDLQTIYMIPIYPYDGAQSIRSNVYNDAHRLIHDVLSI